MFPGIILDKMLSTDKFTNLNKMGFSKECLTAAFSRFLGKGVQICLLGGWLGARRQIQGFQGFH